MKMTHDMFWKRTSADCKGYVGLVKTPEKLFKPKPGPLPRHTAGSSLCFPAFPNIT